MARSWANVSSSHRLLFAPKSAHKLADIPPPPANAVMPYPNIWGDIVLTLQ